jgi:hypothetical protein
METKKYNTIMNTSTCASCIWPCSKSPYSRPLWDATPIMAHLSKEKVELTLCVTHPVRYPYSPSHHP